MKIAALIVAAGRGLRAGGAQPKQWQPLAGKSSTFFALRAFADHPDIAHLVLVLHPDDISADLTTGLPKAQIVAGGATRSASVFAGLQALDGRVDQVLIHDAARPCVSRQVIDGVIAALRETVAAAPAVAVVDALWRSAGGHVAEAVPRDGLFRAQTPQGFHLDAILAAHRAHPDGAADDVELARRAGFDVAITPGSEDNLKITLRDDFARAERILGARDGHQTG
ncbi:2-C-methyl-D-erythritol 4-phosphate cytidylyltransferase [Roseobacter cerasinus]|uniref:2-C-methyl-D-erythritol 4-phosphate cytidylyltransferase n=1 Tax=Roseobacter cerasinus TaxID=2602289 RepID=A0A640VR65_9RHOB|nr:2-C-methyl-D-erythritol 4-phosphate cytidylyltransferase [Roseobacter cerasinus]GFE50172.1 2-C-methyl-D-erythritol 4-phosphate cytidylyltransferase [Roseobacter cerasinus]